MADFGTIVASLFNEESLGVRSFHFRHPVWRVQPPVYSKTYRQQTIRTQTGFVLQRLPEDPSQVTMQVSYIPEHKNLQGGAVTPWADDGPTGATWGRIQGVNTLRSLTGNEVTLRWGQNEAKFFFQRMAAVPRGQLLGNDTSEERTTPLVYDFTLTFLQSDTGDWLT